MTNITLYDKDTIAAIATAMGTGGVAIIRISGPNAFLILNTLFDAKSPVEHARMRYGNITGPNGVIDTGYSVFFKGPVSYTGEDTAELHIHGGAISANKVLELVVNTGARCAQPGEFTMRAFINGKMDLTKAEGVADFINAESDACAKEASKQMRGTLGEKLNSIKEPLLELISAAEAAIEYPEEDLEDVLKTSALKILPQTLKKIDELRDSYKNGRLIKHGICVALAGKPNAGKSSLLNALAGERRAIVSDIAGTTRDIVETNISLDGFLFKFKDTAGIRECTDEIETQGVELAHGAINGADIILFTLDASRPIEPEDKIALDIANKSGAKVITLLNKTDILPQTLTKSAAQNFTAGEVIEVCALNTNDSTKIKDALKSAALDNRSQNSVTIINSRHEKLLSQAQSALTDAVKALKCDLGAECVLTDLKDALEFLYEITGENATQDVIDRIFSKFCLGK